MKGQVNIKKRNKIFIYIIIVVMLFSIYAFDITAFNNTYAAVQKSDIKYDASNPASVFPDSYKGYISALKQAHPNWVIKAFYTNLDWNQVINSESSGTYSRVQNSAFSDAWKRTESKNSSNYNAGGFVLASKAAVAYTMDPRNFLNDQSVFQFRVVDQNVNSDTINAVNEAMTYTPMKNTDYDDVITNVGNSLGVSPLFIVSRIRQETGCDTINNTSINGKHSAHPGYYNFFNIGAYDSASSSVQYGINLAYSKGWNTPEKGIRGGVEWMKNNYIKYGQNTVYFQKFDVANPYGNATGLLTYQYMSNISAPASESKIAYDGIVKAGTLNNAYTFYIPIYNNMPAVASPIPGQTVNEYTDDNTRIRVKASVAPDKLYVRSGPGTGYSIIAKLDAGTKMTRIKRSTNTQWDMVKLDNGVTGYVFRDYVEDYPIVKIISLNEKNITMKLNETHKLEYTIEPSNAINKDVEWSSSNSNIVSVSNGTLTSKGAGEVNITIKARETGLTDTCKVVVLADKVESISLEKNDYTLVKGNELTINPVIKPDTALNKDYTVTSGNQNIVSIDGKKIKAVNVGEANITFKTVDQNKTVTAKIKVIDVSQLESIEFNDSVNKDEENKMVSKIEPNTKTSDFLNKVTYNNNKYDIVIKNINGNEISGDSLVGTGTTINLRTKDTKDIIQTYTVLIYGDLNGDGGINTIDLQVMQKSILGIRELNNIQNKSADLNKDGGKPNTIDLQKLQKHILNINKIIQ